MKLMQISVVVMFSLCLSLNVALASGDLSVSGTTTTKNLTITNLNCTTMDNDGALTVDAAGVVSCSDDDAGGSLDAAYDHGGAGAGRTITADSGAVNIQGADGLELDTGSLQQMPGNPVLVGSAAVSSFPESVVVSGRYAYVLSNGDLDVVDVSEPGAPIKVGDLTLGGYATRLFVSSRYAYVVDQSLNEMIVVDVSNPAKPSQVGSIGVGPLPQGIFVSGRYAYLVDSSSDDLKVIDVSDPVLPSQVGSLNLDPGSGSAPRAVYVSGCYAYVLDSVTNELKAIDVSNPAAPTLSDSFAIGDNPISIYVSGRYAYVVDTVSDDIRVIDISDPTALSLAGSLGIGVLPSSVFVSGIYAYVVDRASDDIKVIDVSDPGAPVEVGSLAFTGSDPYTGSVYVSGRYAYVTDYNEHVLNVIDISGAEFTSVIAHSLEAGNLQVRNDVITHGQLQVTGGVNVGAGGIFTDGNVGVSGTIAIANDVVPTSSPANLVQLYTQDEKGLSELYVRDESGWATILSPHNFSLVGQPSEPMAWSFYSENDRGRINVDMLRAVRLVEAMSGRKLVHTEMKETTDSETERDEGVISSGLPSVEELQSKIESYQKLVTPLMQAVQSLKEENERLVNRVEVLEKKSD